jgi:hypothetical protein
LQKLQFSHAADGCTAARLKEEKETLPLHAGDHLAASEFLKRYKATHDDIRAELINGVVYLMFQPISKHTASLIQSFRCGFHISLPTLRPWNMLPPQP